MATVTIKSSGSGTGNFTLEPPTTNTDRTLTLPDEEGTVATIENIPPGYEDQDALDLFNVTGSAPVYACRAWVRFGGTGTVSISESGNVSSITDEGTGEYNINFTTNLPSGYAVAGLARAAFNSYGRVISLSGEVDSSRVRVTSHRSDNLTKEDCDNVTVIAVK